MPKDIPNTIWKADDPLERKVHAAEYWSELTGRDESAKREAERVPSPHDDAEVEYEDGGHTFEDEKDASVPEDLKAPLVGGAIGGTLGAASGAALGYHNSRPGADGKSRSEIGRERKLRDHLEDKERAGKAPGLRAKYHQMMLNEAVKNRKSPLRGALGTAVGVGTVGALSGAGVGAEYQGAKSDHASEL